MAFDALNVSLALVPSLKEPVAVIARTNPDLARQIRRAASSIALNVAEGRRRNGGDRIHLWRVAAGSAGEVVAALDAAVSWGDIGSGDIAEALALLDRINAMLYNMTHK